MSLFISNLCYYLVAFEYLHVFAFRISDIFYKITPRKVYTFLKLLVDYTNKLMAIPFNSFVDFIRRKVHQGDNYSTEMKFAVIYDSLHFVTIKTCVLFYFSLQKNYTFAV